MQGAIRFVVDVPENHVITLPADVPTGRAEVIVLVEHMRAGISDRQQAVLESISRGSPCL